MSDATENNAPFFVAKIIEVLSKKKIRVVYFVTSNVSRLPYGYGAFSEQRDSRNSDRDIGTEEIESILCKFSALNKNGRIPKRVLKMISDSDQVDWHYTENRRRAIETTTTEESEENEDSS